MVIAGSGPSLRDINPEEGDVFSLGGAHDWLLERGITPHGWVNADPLPLVAQYIKNAHEGVIYYLASHSHPFVFEAAGKTVVWHDEVGAGTRETVIEEDQKRGLSREHVMVMGGSTGATRAPFVGYWLGYRKIVMVGVDGSGGWEAAVLRPTDFPLTVEVGEETFKSHGRFIHQAKALETIMREFPDLSFDVRGDGLMAAVCRACQ